VNQVLNCLQFRLFNVLLQRLRWRRPSPELQTLFQPLIISTRSPLLELDLYMHKSNSTFFSDVDIARGHLIAALLLSTIRNFRHDSAAHGRGNMLAVVLGGVACTFRKEIKVYQRYEIWTRILCWDEKWIYFVSHFVKKGKVQPKGYSLQPWRRTKTGKYKEGEKASTPSPPPQDALLASVVSKCIFKNKRVTIPVELVLQAAGLLPPKPESADKDRSQISEGESRWDWARIEEERLKGMKVAEAMAGLSSAHDSFNPEEGPALAEYPDFWGLC
jgi:Thioesterase-like superfamily